VPSNERCRPVPTADPAALLRLSRDSEGMSMVSPCWCRSSCSTAFFRRGAQLTVLVCVIVRSIAHQANTELQSSLLPDVLGLTDDFLDQVCLIVISFECAAPMAT
jgi:hypothetical protein